MPPDGAILAGSQPREPIPCTEDDLVDDELGRREYAEDPDGAELADPAKRHDEAPASAGLDPAQRRCICLWCGSGFQRRQDGGKRQRFCAEPGGRAFAKAALTWAAEAVASGALAREESRSGPSAMRRSIAEAKPVSDVVG